MPAVRARRKMVSALAVDHELPVVLGSPARPEYIREIIDMATLEEVLQKLTVPPVRRSEVRESTFSVCQAPGCGKEFPGWPESASWLQFNLNSHAGSWSLYFCSWTHVAAYATAAAEL